MKKRTFTPISVLIGVLLLALAAAMTTFVADSDIAHAQTATSISVGGEQVPGFADDTHDYTNTPIKVSSTTTHISVSASPGASATLNSIKYSLTDLSNNAGTSITITDVGGTVVTNNRVPLASGDDTDIAFLMTTGANPTDATVYVVRVTRVASDASDDATLTGLTITNPDVTFSPTFVSGTLSYTAFVPHDVDDGSSGTIDNAITITPTAATGATATVTSDKDSEVASNVVELVAGRNVISIKVVAADVVTTKTYTITVTRAAENASDDARLSSLTVGGKSVPLSNINGGDQNVDYTTRVSYATSSVQVRANTVHSGANVVIRTGADASASVGGDIDADGNISLTENVANFIAVQVTAEDGKSANRKNYILSVTRAGENAKNVANLATLAIGSDLSPSFAAATTSYRAYVPYATQEVTVTTTVPDDSNATVKISPDDSNATAENHQVELSTGQNTITVMVEAEDVVTTKTYTITVTRASQTALDEARLSALRVGGESVSVSGFGADDDTVDYTTTVPNSMTFVQVVATPKDSNALVAIRTSTASANASRSGTIDADGRIPLTAGQAMYITVEVTAANGIKQNDYILQVTRAVQGASDNAKLAATGGIAVAANGSAVTLSPSYDADVTSYTASVPYDTDDGNDAEDLITVTATGANSGATVTVTSDKDETVGDTNVASHISVSAVNLEEGANVITVKVKAADALATKTYTITVTRAAENASDDASLSSLTVGGKAVPLPLTASNSAVAYTDGVANGVYSIQINATATHSGATVVLRRVTSNNPGDSITGTVDADGNIPLVVGYRNFIAVQVTAEDGKSASRKNYILQINRAPAAASDNAKLRASDGLSISVGILTPTFDPDKTEYTADVGSADSSVTVTAIGFNNPSNNFDNDNATVSVISDKDDTVGDTNGATEHSVSEVNLEHGANVITINVTAADYVATNTYTVTITRAAAIDDASLSSLSLTDGAGMDIALDPAFDAATDAYTASVDSTVTEANVMASAAGSDATVEVMYGADDTEVTAGDDGSYSVPLTEGENTVKVTVTAEDLTTTMTYTVGITVSPADPSFALFDKYDTDDNNMIDKSEVVDAINDYLVRGTITKADVVTLIRKYLSGDPISE